MGLTNKYTLKPSLAEKFDGIIWKIETDERQTIAAVETRNIEHHTASVSAFNFSTGETLFKDLKVENSWHWSLDRVHQGMIFLHGYVSEQSPEHKGIIAINQNGDIAWHHFNKTFYDVSEQGLITYNPSVEPRIQELLSPKEGTFLKFPADDLTALSRDIIFPDLKNDRDDFRGILPENIAGPVAFCKFNGRTFLSFHLQRNGFYDQKLIIADGTAILLDDFLEQGIQKMNPEAFFIQHNHLFCIRNKKQEFVSYLV